VNHELLDRQLAVEGSSDRSFGFVFAAFFFILAVYPIVHGAGVRWWPMGVALAFLIAALVRPRVLAPLNRLWFGFGLLLGKVMAPVAMAILFYGVVSPIGFLMRLTGKDVLRLRPQPAETTYWIERTPRGPHPESMKNQF
jgi:hypothetical protein